VLLDAQLLQGQLAKDGGDDAKSLMIVTGVRERAQKAGLGLLVKKATL